MPKRNLQRPFQCNVLLNEEEDGFVDELSTHLKVNRSEVVRKAIVKLHAKEIKK